MEKKAGPLKRGWVQQEQFKSHPFNKNGRYLYRSPDRKYTRPRKSEEFSSPQIRNRYPGRHNIPMFTRCHLLTRREDDDYNNEMRNGYHDALFIILTGIAQGACLTTIMTLRDLIIGIFLDQIRENQGIELKPRINGPKVGRHWPVR